MASEYVIVGCKLPSGIIMEMITPSKGRQLLPSPVGERHIIKGSNSTLIHVPKSAMGPPAQGEHQYATTRVPAEFAKAWFERNKDLDCVKRGLIFVVPDVKAATSEIKDRTGDPQTRTGLEALAEKDDPRLKAASKRNQVTADSESMDQWESNAA